MLFACLGDQEVKCHMNGIFAILGLAGTMCLLGLAGGHPVRGGIEIAWGAMLHPGELYGPAVARAYALESEVAQYPRIVVGAETYKFICAHSTSTAQDPFSQNDRQLATQCLDMLWQDADGNLAVHYLGRGFSTYVNKSPDLYQLARKFVIEEFERQQRAFNTKLAFRYAHLLQYIEAFPPLGR